MRDKYIEVDQDSYHAFLHTYLRSVSRSITDDRIIAYQKIINITYDFELDDLIDPVIAKVIHRKFENAKYYILSHESLLNIMDRKHIAMSYPFRELIKELYKDFKKEK